MKFYKKWFLSFIHEINKFFLFNKNNKSTKHFSLESQVEQEISELTLEQATLTLEQPALTLEQALESKGLYKREILTRFYNTELWSHSM